MTRCACIDIGSNTTRLLVAEADGGAPARGALRARVHAAGRGARRAGRDRAATRSPRSPRSSRARCASPTSSASTSLRVVATAAVRERASTARALAAAIDAACGARLEILDAARTRRGWRSPARSGCSLSRPPGLLGVVDVGGGSTELVVGTRGRRRDVVGLAAARLVRRSPTRDLPSDPPTAAELARAARQARRARSPACDAPQPAVAYAVGGSATSLQRLVGVVLEPRGARARAAGARHPPGGEVALRLGLHAERARLLPAGILLLDAAVAGAARAAAARRRRAARGRRARAARAGW